jgi:Cu+-exporting ATPase
MDVYIAPNSNEKELLTAAASVEAASEHPLANAVVNYSRAREAPLQPVREFTAIAGKGALAKLADDLVLVGSPAMLNERGLALNGAADNIEKFEQDGKTVVVVARNRRLLGALAIADTVKPEAPAVIAEVHRMGIETVMLTGDNQPHCRGAGPPAGHSPRYRRSVAERESGRSAPLQKNSGPSRWWVMASTMLRRWPSPMSALLSAPAPILPSKQQM